MTEFDLPENLPADEIRRRLRVPAPEEDKLLTPAEVARLFRADPKTITRWAKAGKLTSIRTLGGHRRYLESEVQGLISASRQERTDG